MIYDPHFLAGFISRTQSQKSRRLERLVASTKPTSVRVACPSCDGDGFNGSGGNCETCQGGGKVWS